MSKLSRKTAIKRCLQLWDGIIELLREDGIRGDVGFNKKVCGDKSLRCAYINNLKSRVFEKYRWRRTVLHNCWFCEYSRLDDYYCGCNDCPIPGYTSYRCENDENKEHWYNKPFAFWRLVKKIAKDAGVEV